jgi:hypothetical protein
MLRQGDHNSALSPGAIRLLVAAFFALGLLLILRHVLWQDEWQAWLLVRDSRSLAELFHNLRYEGHPGLWYLPLYVLSRFTAQPLAMQLLHLTLATATVYVFLRFAPFTRLQKTLFIFGYFPFFEYAVISRSYTAGVLLLFTYCAVFPRTFPRKHLVLAGLLFLLCQTSIYGLLVALALGAALLVGELTDNRPSLAPSKYQLLAAAVILAAGVGLSILQLLPPPDSGVVLGWKFDLDGRHAVRTLGTIWGSYVPVPAWQAHFWETNLIGNPYLKLGLSLLLLGFAFCLFWRQPAALTLLALGTLAILSFTYTKYIGSIRHHGHLFLLLVAGLWLSGYYPLRDDRPGILHRITDFCRRHRQGFIAALLGAQLLAGLLATGLSLGQPFSAGRETARYIKAQGWADKLIAGDEDDAASVVSGYLERPIFSLCSNRWCTFVISDQQRQNLEAPEALQKARELAECHRQEVLLVMNREIKTPAAEAMMLRRFTRSTVPAETYYLYLVPYVAKPPGPLAETLPGTTEGPEQNSLYHP